MPSNNIATTLPTVKRRLMSMVYELLLGAAALFLPLLVFEMATSAGQSRTIVQLRWVLCFVVLGLYFVHQWTREGQTLAMRTWRLKLVRPGHVHVAPRVALLRYLLCWLWVLPAAIVCTVFDLQHWQALQALLAGIVLWALTAFLNKDRQFLHDKLAGTRLVQLPPLPKKTRTASRGRTPLGSDPKR